MKHRGDSSMARVECLHDLLSEVRGNEGPITIEDDPVTHHQVQAIGIVWCQVLRPLL